MSASFFKAARRPEIDKIIKIHDFAELSLLADAVNQWCNNNQSGALLLEVQQQQYVFAIDGESKTVAVLQVAPARPFISQALAKLLDPTIRFDNKGILDIAARTYNSEINTTRSAENVEEAVKNLMGLLTAKNTLKFSPR